MDLIYKKEGFEQMLNYSYLQRKIMLKKIKPVCEKYGLRKTEIMVLLMLNLNQRFRTAKEIEEYGGLKRGIISFSVETLCKCGFLIQQEAEDDRRKKYLVLTEKAQTPIAECEEIINLYRQAIFEGVSRDDLEVCKKVFMQMTENLKKL